MAKNGSRTEARGRQMYFEFDELRRRRAAFLKVLELAKEYGAAVVVGTIDEEGMARTAKGN
jgi:cobalamin-dependent methionine synthase I